MEGTEDVASVCQLPILYAMSFHSPYDPNLTQGKQFSKFQSQMTGRGM